MSSKGELLYSSSWLIRLALLVCLRKFFASSWLGFEKEINRHRLVIVGSKLAKLFTVKIIRQLLGGSSIVFNRALDAATVNLSAPYTTTIFLPFA